MTDKGFFGDLFDLDGDGRLDDTEYALDFAAFADLVDEEDDPDDEELF